MTRKCNMVLQLLVGVPLPALSMIDWAYGERPDDWSSPHGLVFAMVGRCSVAQEDDDLKMAMPSGPSGVFGKGKRKKTYREWKGLR